MDYESRLVGLIIADRPRQTIDQRLTKGLAKSMKIAVLNGDEIRTAPAESSRTNIRAIPNQGLRVAAGIMNDCREIVSNGSFISRSKPQLVRFTQRARSAAN